MAKLVENPRIVLSVTLSLNEEEVRAFDALVGYGDDAFIKEFYETLGESYMKKHEAGLRSLFKSFRECAPGILSRVDAARIEFER